ncbi:MAG TPA: GNAT family N-acetyltransferase, partial [Dehalococcoidia bacterium]
MPAVTCVCQQRFEGADEEALFRALRAHSDETHAALKLSDQQVRDYVAAALRATGGTERLERIGTPEIHALTPERLDDFLRFFDHDAFANNPAWASCYCVFHYYDGADWGNRGAAENRADMQDRICTLRAQGYLAYVDGRPAGWINAAPRAIVTNIPEPEDGDDGRRIGAIACFVIAPPYRRHGLARLLLDAAIEGFRARGFTAVEGYPPRDPKSDSSAYMGPPGLFRDAGFAQVR